jgi:hypothetical protein
MEAGALPSRWGEYARRLPSSLEDLKGPAAGTVELPAVQASAPGDQRHRRRVGQRSAVLPGQASRALADVRRGRRPRY